MPRSLLRVALILLLCAIAKAAPAVGSTEARVTAVVNEVTLAAGEAAVQPAAIGDGVSEQTAVRTGAGARAEVTLPARAVARIGANTGFHVKARGRRIELEEGVILLQAPKSARGTRIEAAAVGAAVTGATVVFENQAHVFKFLVLQGTARLYRPGHFGESMLVRAGQLVFGDPNQRLTQPAAFDIERFVKTCRLVNQFPPLTSVALIAAESRKQEKAKARKRLIDTNMVIFGNGTLVSLVDPDPASKPAAEPSPAGPAALSIAPRPESNPMAAIQTARDIAH